MSLSGPNLIKGIREKAGRPMKMKELAKTLGVSAPEYTNFRNSVKKLINSGDLVKLKRGRIGISSELDVLVGKITIRKSGIGFLIREKEDDILIPSGQTSTALDGDTVMVRFSGKYEGRVAGTVIKVVERTNRNIVGSFKFGKHFSVVVPDNPRIHRDLYIPSDSTLDAQSGEKVVAVLTEWDDPYLNPEGKVTERLGLPGQVGVDMMTIIRSFDLPEEFPEDVLTEAELAAASLDDDAGHRLDLTKDTIYTIDPHDAKDHDDAISVSKTAEGYRLGVHIADVSHYVKPGSSLDREALRRGNSVYLPGMVVPMLPEVLSNDVCSLRPDRKRLAHSIFIDFDRTGKMLKWKIADTIINSCAKLSYEEVQQFFDNGGGSIPNKKISDNLTLARELAKLLTQKRFAEGSLDFDLPESKIVLNDKGHVLEISNRIRLESHRLVEEFMLAANKAVALEATRQRKHFLFRVHDHPDEEKITEFSEVIKRLGYSFPVSDSLRPIQFSRFLEKIKDAPEADFINELMLRSMKKAVYQRENIGHFGLAFTHYAHFTSPIRRYPDLVVHRLLRLISQGKYTGKFAESAPGMIDRIGRHCSDTERVAEAAEREGIKVKQVQFMARHIGGEFDGVISGVARWGFWVRLDNLGAEGLVRISSIDDDYYHFDEKHYRLMGRRRQRSFRMGDRVRITVLRVDDIKNEIELLLAGTKIPDKVTVEAAIPARQPSRRQKHNVKYRELRKKRRKRVK